MRTRELFTAIILVTMQAMLNSWAWAQNAADAPVVGVQNTRAPLEEGHKPPQGPLEVGKKWSYFRAYIPEKRDLELEIGSMWENDPMYWIGAMYGFHLGRCILTESQTCQHYFDLIGGVGGRDGLTVGTFLTSLRWQFVNFPQVYAPSVSLYVGAQNINDNQRFKQVAAYGIGYGMTVSIHERVDLKLQMRAGYGDQYWGQVFVAALFKADKWVDYFSTKLKEFGIGAVETTGDVLKGTVTAPVKAVDWMKKDNEKDKAKKNQPQGGTEAGEDNK